MYTGWVVTTLLDETHVTPIHDNREHLDSTACWCSPFRDGSIVIHNSADGREFSEASGAMYGGRTN